jgi:hypothetical protein
MRAMRTTTFFLTILLFVSVCFGQSQQTIIHEAKNKIVLKVINLQKEQDALVMDRILSQCKNIYSSKTNFKTGFCEIIADKIVSNEKIKEYLLNSGYIFQPVSIKSMTDQEVEIELNSGDNNIKQVK